MAMAQADWFSLSFLRASLYFIKEIYYNFMENLLIGIALLALLILVLAAFYPLYRSIRLGVDKNYKPGISDKILNRI